jgi:hypothetical protein
VNGQPFDLDSDSCHLAHNEHGTAPPPAAPPGTNTLNDMGAPLAAARRALFTDCTHCHTQVHGSDLPGDLSGEHRLFR